MLIRDVIGFVLGNIQVPLAAVALFTTASKLRRASARHEIVTWSYVLWGEALFYCVGLGFVYTWYFHAFQSRYTAAFIGWQPSPFEWELAWAELGIATVALLGLWRGYEMRLSATLAYAMLSFGAAAQHIHLIAVAHNYAPGNAGIVLWFGDIALPFALLLLALASQDAYERTALRRTRI